MCENIVDPGSFHHLFRCTSITSVVWTFENIQNKLGIKHKYRHYLKELLVSLVSKLKYQS